MLQEGDDEVLYAQAYGGCHISCLLQSRWGSHWANLVLRHLESGPQMIRLYDDGIVVALAHKHTKDILVLRSNGMIWSLRRREVKSVRRTENGWQIPVDAEFNFAIRDQEPLIREVQERLSHMGQMPLLEILQLLGVAEKLYSPDALQDGWLVAKEELKRHWSATAVSARTRYAISLPDDIHNIWKFCSRKLGSLPAK